MAGDVLAEVAGDEPHLEIVFAAGADADEHVDDLAFVEVGDRIGAAGRCACEQASRDGERWSDPATQNPLHVRSSLGGVVIVVMPGLVSLCPDSAER